MTIDKAIEILKQYIPDPDSVSVLDSVDAIKLGISALKRIRSLRLVGIAFLRGLMEGETKD